MSKKKNSPFYKVAAFLLLFIFILTTIIVAQATNYNPQLRETADGSSFLIFALLPILFIGAYYFAKKLTDSKNRISMIIAAKNK